MKKEKYELMLEEFLGTIKYKELREFTVKSVKEVFGKQTGYVTKKLIYANHSAILIIAALRAKEAGECEILNNLHINDMNSSKYFIEKDIDKFIDVYSEYINIITEEIKKRRDE
ncbi:MAG: hypothetical protein E7310_07580 [Clostridiales bacterium]|nr:hypothetical protein [Clostridiales bacterium]